MKSCPRCQAGYVASDKVELETSFVRLLLPTMLASRLTSRRAKPQKSSKSEFSLLAWLNRLFEIIMNLERCLVRVGLRFKQGGSLLLIASKER